MVKRTSLTTDKSDGVKPSLTTDNSDDLVELDPTSNGFILVNSGINPQPGKKSVVFG